MESTSEIPSSHPSVINLCFYFKYPTLKGIQSGKQITVYILIVLFHPNFYDQNSLKVDQ